MRVRDGPIDNGACLGRIHTNATLRTLFTSAWKTAGALTSPNGSTRYSKWPMGILKAVFHSSPSLMEMNGYKLQWVPILNSYFVEPTIIYVGMQRTFLLFHERKKKLAPVGEKEGTMVPAANKSAMYFSSALRLGADKE